MARTLSNTAALAILSGISICSADQGQPPENGLTTSDVIARLTSMDEARLQSLQEYSSVRRYTLENTRFGTAAVKPKAPTKYHFVGRIWVDAEDFAVARIEGTPAVKPSIWISKTAFVHTYKKVVSFWLPKSNTYEGDVRAYG
jgi:hypothetical protein